MLTALLAYIALLAFAIARRDGGQVVTTSLLLGNWAACSAFVYFAGLDFPWMWYLTIDWLTAFTLWIDRDTIWQRLLIVSYAIELLLHAAFAYVTRTVDNPEYWSRTDWYLYQTQMHYHDALSLVAWAQCLVIGTWIAYDAVRHWRRADRRFPSFMARNNKVAP